jgi:hypothetical protein
VKREVLYNILIEFGVPMKLVRMIKICLNETFSKVRIGKHLSEIFVMQNGLKQGDALSPLLLNFALEYTVRKVQENQLVLKFNGSHQLQAYADNMNLPSSHPKRDEMTVDWRKLHDEELHGLYSPPSLIIIIRSRRMR